MYQGKYDARYRNTNNAQPAAPKQRVPRPTAEADPDENLTDESVIQDRPDPQKKKKRIGSTIFYSLYFVCIAVFCFALLLASRWLDNWLNNYEASQPYAKCTAVFNELFATPDWARIYDLAAGTDTAYEGSEAFVRYMTQKVGDQKLYYTETSAGLSGDKKYFIKAGDEKVASFTLKKSEGTDSHIPNWVLSSVDLFYEGSQDVYIQKLENHTAYVNGMKLGDDLIVKKTTSKAEEYLPKGTTGIRTTIQHLSGLLMPPEVTIQDENGKPMKVVLNEETGMYVEQFASEDISQDLIDRCLKATEEYAKRMIKEPNNLKDYFDTQSEIYKSISRSETWMQKNKGYKFSNQKVTDYIRYSDTLFSARVITTLNVTRNDGTVKDYNLDSTLFMEKKSSGKWMVINMTNVDVLDAVTQVRLVCKDGDTVLSDKFYDANSRTLTLPQVTVPEGKVFSGWVRETVDAQGKTVLSLVFTPDEKGVVTLAGNYTLEPMVIYPLFEKAESEGA